MLGETPAGYSKTGDKAPAKVTLSRPDHNPSASSSLSCSANDAHCHLILVTRAVVFTLAIVIVVIVTLIFFRAFAIRVRR